MARVKIDETILEDVTLTMSGGRLCLRVILSLIHI